MLKALRQPQLFRLWLGQTFSSLGDEIYRVGLTWFAIGLLGADTGYLTAGQTAALMLLSFFGGKWADRWHPIKTMVSVDLIRAFIVLIPVTISYFGTVSISCLWIVALTLAALSAFFDPATQATIPILAKDNKTLQATNGLMGTTIRLARMVGPAIVGLFAALIPMIHFFTLDALTFIISAICVYPLIKFVPTDPETIKRTDFKESIKASFRLIRQRAGMRYIFLAKALTSGTWSMALMIGFPLLVHNSTGGDARSFGLVMASYGVGNFAGAIFFGSRLRSRLMRMLFGGYVWLGMGFILIGIAPTIGWIVLAACFTGFSGPMNDLAFIDLVQKEFAIKDLAKIFRLRITVESAGTLFFTLISPILIKTITVRGVIVLCGTIWILVGVLGYHLLKQQDKNAEEKIHL